MKISSKSLIAMLNPNAQDNREIGFNSAIIQILQNNIKPKELTPYEKRREIYKQYLLHYPLFSENQVKELDEIVLGGYKLQAVKFHKDVTGCGLKESKECFDTIIPIIEKLPK